MLATASCPAAFGRNSVSDGKDDQRKNKNILRNTPTCVRLDGEAAAKNLVHTDRLQLLPILGPQKIQQGQQQQTTVYIPYID